MPSATAAAGESLMLRPGVAWPLWPVVTDATARQALVTGLGATCWLEKWAGLETAADRLWREILRGFARTGRAQDIAGLAAAIGLEVSAVIGLVRGLRLSDRVVLDEDGAAVTAAYPFCAWRTGHRVALAGGEAVPSLCAIDALGAGAMLREDAVVTSQCRLCGEPVRVETRDRGSALRSAQPGTTVVWYGIGYAGNCSATSGCTLKTFFCSEAHLADWRAGGDRAGRGFALSLPAALQIALAIFLPLLMPEAVGPVD